MIATAYYTTQASDKPVVIMTAKKRVTVRHVTITIAPRVAVPAVAKVIIPVFCPSDFLLIKDHVTQRNKRFERPWPTDWG